MDILSDVIATMRTGAPHSGRTRWHAPWGRRYLPVPGVGFHMVLQGSCWLIPPDGAPVALGMGDVVLMAHGREHGLADSPSTPLDTPACDPHAPFSFARPPWSPVGDESDGDGSDPTTVTLCGAYQLDPARAHPMLDDLPEIVHLPARLGQHPELRAAVDLLGGELENPRLGADAIVPALLDMLLLYVLRAWFDGRAEDGAATGWTAALGDPAISAALRAVHAEPAGPWTVETLGARAGLSRAAFARRFAELTGRPPLAYLT